MKILEKIAKIKNNQSKVFDAGKQDEYDAFWDAFQVNGQRRDYRQGMAGSGWTDAIFNPKYDIVVEGSAQNMFWGSKIIDMVGILERNKVSINTSGATDLSYAFSCNSVYLPEVSAVSATNLTTLFGYNRNLISIKKLILKSDGSQTFPSAFYNCTSLKNIEIEGVIGNNIDFKTCPLVRESFIGEEITEDKYNSLPEDVRKNNVYISDNRYYYGGIITALKSDASGKTVTFNKVAKEAAFTDDEWSTLTATKSNWTFNLV